MGRSFKSIRESDLEIIQRTLFTIQINEINQTSSIKDKYQHIEEYKLLIEELLKESDRGLVLVIAAHLEKIIKELLEKKLIGSNSHKKKLLSFNGPLGTFSSKIAMSFSIGLLSKFDRIEIDKIRKIRNEFAHSFRMINMDSTKIDDMANGLEYFPKDFPNLTNKEKIIFSFSVLYGRLIILKESDNKFNELQPGIKNFEGYYKALKIIEQGDFKSFNFPLKIKNVEK